MTSFGKPMFGLKNLLNIFESHPKYNYISADDNSLHFDASSCQF